MPDRVRAHRLRNLALTFALVVGVVGTAAFMGWLVAGPLGVWLTLGAALALGFFAPAPPMERALQQQGARRLFAPWLEDAVDRLSERAGIDAPVLLVLPAPSAQAFATRGRRGDAIGLTPALLNRLSPREVLAVVAHELSHLRAGDLGLMRVLGVVGSLSRSLSQVGLFLLFFGLPLSLLTGWALPWLTIAALLTAPWLIHSMTLALSRLREHDADAGAVELTGDPLALASALMKIEATSRGPWWTQVFRVEVPERWQTHPRTEARVARLREMAGRTRRLAI